MVKMPKLILTKSMQAFIRMNRLLMSSGELAEKLDCSKTTVQRFLKINNLTPPKKILREFRSKAMKSISSATPAEDKFLKKNYLKLPSKRLADKLGRSDVFVRTRLRQLGLEKPKWLIEKFVQDARLKKGNVPPNKGKKQSEYMTMAQIRRTAKTRFKKGHIPHNALGIKDGDITIRHTSKKKGSKPYKWIRIRMGIWEMYHVHVWKKRFGPVPDGYIIVFRNGDTMNCRLSNLKCITRQEHAENTRNSDGYIARTMAYNKGAKFKTNPEILEYIKSRPDLIEAKRSIIQLNKQISKQLKIRR